MPTRSSHPLLNALGFLAYLSCLFQWVFVLLPFLPGVLDSDVFHAFIPLGTSDTSVNVQPAQQLPNWLIFIIVAVITLAVVLVTIIALARLPRSVGKTGQKLTRTAAERVIPVVTHHAKLPEKKRRALTARIVFDIKLAMIALPIVLLLIIPLPETTIPSQAITLVVALAAGWSLLLFCLQVVFARAFKVPLDRLW